MKHVFFTLIALAITTPSLLAGPHGCPPPPPPPHHHHGGHGCYEPSGLRTAAEIVGLVGVSAATLGALSAAAQPVVVPQPVVAQQPVVTQTQPTVIVQQPEKPQPKSVTIMPDGTRIEKY